MDYLYIQQAVNPVTKEWESAEILEDYYGPHKYGVRFSDGKVYPEDDVETESNNSLLFVLAGIGTALFIVGALAGALLTVLTPIL